MVHLFIIGCIKMDSLPIVVKNRLDNNDIPTGSVQNETASLKRCCPRLLLLHFLIIWILYNRY